MMYVFHILHRHDQWIQALWMYTWGPWATSLTWVILANISYKNTCKITFLYSGPNRSGAMTSLREKEKFSQDIRTGRLEYFTGPNEFSPVQIFYSFIVIIITNLYSAFEIVQFQVSSK
jgi:hypothetical protein